MSDSQAASSADRLCTEESQQGSSETPDDDSTENLWELLSAYKFSVLAGVLGIVLWWSWPTGNEVATPHSSESSAVAEIAAELAAVETKQTEQLKHRRLTLEAADRGAMEEVISRSQVLLGQLEELTSAQADWKSLADSIFDSETGRRIAASQEALVAVASLLDKQRIDDDFADRLRTRIETTIAPLEQALSEQSYFQPPGEAVLFLEEHLTEVPKIIRSFGEDLQTINGLASDHTPGKATFGEALAALQHEHQIERSQTIAAAVEKERLLGNQRIAAAEAAAEKAAKLREEQRIEREARQKAEAALQALLEQKANRPDVQRLLAPFITPGHWIPYANRAFVPQPMSWNMIRARCLTDDETARSQLIYLACSPADKDRPREHWVGKGHNFNTTPRLSSQILAEVQQRQQLLQELGPALVRLKMLSE